MKKVEFLCRPVLFVLISTVGTCHTATCQTIPKPIITTAPNPPGSCHECNLGGTTFTYKQPDQAVKQFQQIQQRQLEHLDMIRQQQIRETQFNQTLRAQQADQQRVQREQQRINNLEATFRTMQEHLRITRQALEQQQEGRTRQQIEKQLRDLNQQEKMFQKDMERVVREQHKVMDREERLAQNPRPFLDPTVAVRWNPEGENLARGKVFVEGHFDKNTGLLLMNEMETIGKEQQYWYPMQKDKYHTQEQIEFFEQRELVPYAKFGENGPYYKAEGTTNCVTAPLEALYRFLGGEGGSINGIPITDSRFNSFPKDFLGNKRSWINALVKAQMGEEVTNQYLLQVGDLVQTEGHRAFVADRSYDNEGYLQYVLILDANLPKAAENWQTRSAIRKDNWISIKTIKYAFRFYDVAPQPGVGVWVQKVTPELIKSLGWDEPKGALVIKVDPHSPAERVGILRGDIILKYNGYSILDAKELARLVADTAPGTNVLITVWRDGKENEFDVTIVDLTEAK